MALNIDHETLSILKLVLIIMTDLFLSISTLVQARNFCFSVELIHRDSPKSPLYNASELPSNRWGNALQRSISRTNSYKQSLRSNAAQSSLVFGNGDYLMTISIGTPPIEVVAVADTGSDLTWIQCEPCYQCYKQDTSVFNPKNSSTYRNLTCDSLQCQFLTNQTFCVSNTSTCLYIYAYGDFSSTVGVLATEQIGLGSNTGQPRSLPNTAFGCGTDNVGNFEGAGIVGLGRGPLSLVSRMDHLINGKFSYCLVPSYSNHSSKMYFGATSVVSGPEVVTTPLVSGDIETFYYLKLEAVSVGAKRLELNYNNHTYNSTEGNIIIDSGTTLTFLPEDLYNRLDSEVKNAISSKPTGKGFAEGFSLCYEDKPDFNPPNITMHFTGADVELKAVNTFMPVIDNVLCFAFFPGDDTLSIYGNRQQINFLIGYDLTANTLSFRPADCTKY